MKHEFGLRLLKALFLLVLCWPVSPAKAQTEALSDKSIYSLFNPTPARYMREMSADRPDKTDCPFTVDAGHFQVEMDFANATLNRPNSERGNVRSDTVEVAPMNVKVGLFNDLDFHLILTPYAWQRTEDHVAGTVVRQSGFIGITPRFKLNLVGNDGGFFALALMPFITLPLNQDHLGSSTAEGGLGIPFSFDVPGWDVGFQSTFHYNRNETGGGYHSEFDSSVSIGHQLIGKLSLAAEFFSSVSTERDASVVATVGTWLTYQVHRNLRLDGGVHIGVRTAADDWHPWLGMTWRF